MFDHDSHIASDNNNNNNNTKIVSAEISFNPVRIETQALTPSLHQVWSDSFIPGGCGLVVSALNLIECSHSHFLVWSPSCRVQHLHFFAARIRHIVVFLAYIDF